MLSGLTREVVIDPVMRLAALILLTGLLALCQGCATTDDDADLPWNTQEPWEAHPGIPGLSDY